MHIVTAGVHHARILRTKRERIFFLYGQSVHVRPDSGGAGLIGSANEAADAVPGYAGRVRYAQSFKLRADQPGGFFFLSAQLRMPVQAASDFHCFVKYIVCQRSDQVQVICHSAPPSAMICAEAAANSSGAAEIHF